MFKPLQFFQNQSLQLQALQLQTPHSGYHWDGNSSSYFEGWYLKLTLLEIQQTFAFMYSLADPLVQDRIELKQDNRPNNSGGAVQILGIEEEYLCRTLPQVSGFWADRNSLKFSHWGKTKGDRNTCSRKPQLLTTEEFTRHIQEGYQVTPTLNQGSIYDPRRQNYCRWQYQIRPIYGWGTPYSSQQATGGLLSYLPFYNPGWQITMAHGLATGWIEWSDHKYQFNDVPAYSEKNWGTSFPRKWFWLNCNSFEDQSELALTVAGGIRELFGWQETVGLIGIHYQGEFYEFAPWNSKISWCVKPWGEWQVTAKSDRHSISLLGSTDLSGNYVRTPTAQGLILNCRDTNRGKLLMKLRTANRTILEATSNLAGLEIGGQPWHSNWIVDNAE